MDEFSLDYTAIPPIEELMEYRVADLIDLLSINNVKIFMLVDIVSGSKAGERDAEVAEYARKIQVLNSQRSVLRNCIESKLTAAKEEEVKV